jgi:carbohydrate-binding DOMON domain-containing protein
MNIGLNRCPFPWKKPHGFSSNQFDIYRERGGTSPVKYSIHDPDGADDEISGLILMMIPMSADAISR